MEQVTRVDSQNMGVYTVYRLGNGSDCPCTKTPKERQAILVITIQNFEVNSAVEKFLDSSQSIKKLLKLSCKRINRL